MAAKKTGTKAQIERKRAAADKQKELIDELKIRVKLSKEEERERLKGARTTRRNLEKALKKETSQLNKIRRKPSRAY